MTKDELRQEIERLKAEVTHLKVQILLANSRMNMLEVSSPSVSPVKLPRQRSITDPDQYDV